MKLIKDLLARNEESSLRLEKLKKLVNFREVSKLQHVVLESLRTSDPWRQPSNRENTQNFTRNDSVVSRN